MPEQMRKYTALTCLIMGIEIKEHIVKVIIIDPTCVDQ
jgi:hypothetical protein